MQFTPILALADKASTSIMDAVPHLAGMLMVLGTLAVLWGLCAVTAKLVQIFVPEPKAATAPIAKTAQATAKSAAPRPDTSADIPPEVVAAIAAAVATVTDKTHRIISIKPMSTSWERAGRQSVLTSHRIR